MDNCSQNPIFEQFPNFGSFFPYLLGEAKTNILPVFLFWEQFSNYHGAETKPIFSCFSPEIPFLAFEAGSQAQRDRKRQRDRETEKHTTHLNFFDVNFFSAALKGTNLRGQTPICGFLQVPARFLRFPAKKMWCPAKICVSQMVCFQGKPKGPFRTKNTTMIAKIVNYYSVVFLLRPPKCTTPWTPSLRGKMSVIPRKIVSNTRRAAIVNHPAVLKTLRRSNSLFLLPS